MSTQSTFRLAATIPWGETAQTLSPTLETYPLFADTVSEQRRQVYAPVRLRVDHQGGMHALADAALRRGGAATVYLAHLDADGALRGRTPLAPDHPEAVAWRIRDYEVDAEGNSYLLETLEREQGPPLNRVRKVNRDGGVMWARVGDGAQGNFDVDTFDGAISQLLMDGHGTVYVLAAAPTGVLARLDPQTGEAAARYAWEEGIDPAFMSAAGTAFCVVYVPEARRRAMAAFDPESGEKKIILGDDILFGWLIYPIGVDREGHFYAARRGDLARIAFEGQVLWQDRVENIVVRASEGAVLVSRSHADAEGARSVAVQINTPDGASVERRFAIPRALTEENDGAWRLIHVDEDNTFYVFGGEEPGRPGTLLLYSEAGRLEEKTGPSPDLLTLESRLEHQDHWVVGGDGSLYLPVTDPTGLRVIRLTPQAR